MRATAAVLLLLSLVLASACTSARHTTAPTTTTTTSVVATTTSTSTTTTTVVAPVAAIPATAACPAVPARALPRADRPRYVLRVDVRPADNVVIGSVDVRFTPDIPTDRLVFRLWANGPRPAGAGARLDVPEVRVGAHPATVERPDPTTLVVRLTSPLAAGQEVGATAPFTLTLPKPVDDRISRSGDAIRLGSFFPILAWEPGVGWATDPAVSGFAEASTAPTADFAASVTVPPGFDVLATGVPDGSGRWFAPAVSDFALSVGHFRQVHGKAGPVDVTVGVDQSVGAADNPDAYLARIIDSLNDYSARFGPYPWPAYTMAVTPNLRGGIEYPMHVMQGPGSSGRTTPHEAGHQWFFALVENDQGRDPWLDEGLASWAEATHERTLATFVGRAIPFEGKGKLGQPMAYWEPRQSIYYASVYVQGVQLLAALGPPGTVDCILRQYVARTAFRIARPADLLAAARLVVGDKAAAVFSSFGVA